MITLARSKSSDLDPHTRVTLPHNKRVKARVRVTLDDGRDAGIFMQRGERLRQGDKLISEEGVVVEVTEADEFVSIVQIPDSLALAKACYHLGNRHVQLEVKPGELRYLHDHVLDDMLRQQGHVVVTGQVPFNPESGSYGSDHHMSAHSHEHSHTHGHHEHAQKGQSAAEQGH